MKYRGPQQTGSLANQTASRNRYGQYYRARVGRGGTPTRSIAGAVAAWQALTLSQQQSWWTWDEQIVTTDTLGQEQILGGPSRFYSAWLYAALFGQVVTTPAGSRAPGLTVENLTLTAIGRVWTATGDIVGAAGLGWLEVWSTFPAASTGTTRPPGRGTYWRFEGGSSTAGGDPLTTTHDWTFVTGTRLWVRARVIGEDWIPGPWALAGPVDLA